MPEHQPKGTQLTAPGDTVVASTEDALIDQVVSELNELHSRASLEAALQMGEIIVNRFYGGDTTTWRRHKAKDVSFRKLAARADLRVSPTTLYRAVALYELTQRVGIGSGSRLTMTHLRVVVGLMANDQEALLAQAESHGWPAERLEREATKLRVISETRRGRPAVPALVRAVRGVVRSCESLHTVFEEGEARELLPAELQSVYTALDEVKRRLEVLSRRLAARNDPAPAKTGAQLIRSSRVSRA